MVVERVSGRRLIILLFLAALAIPNLYAIWLTLQALLQQSEIVTPHWRALTLAASGTPAEVLYRLDGGGFQFSPLLAYAFGAAGTLGLTAWRVAHLAAVVFLPNWRLAALTLLFFPFWADLHAGTGVSIAFVAAAAAVSGSRVGIGAYLVACILMPQPLLVPVAVWLLWRHSGWRWPFVGATLVHAIVVAFTGLGDDWLLALLAPTLGYGVTFDLGPMRYVGALWIPIGATLAVWCVRRGRLGLASLYASPFWLTSTPLMILLQLVPIRSASSVRGDRAELPPTGEPAPIAVTID